MSPGRSWSTPTRRPANWTLGEAISVAILLQKNDQLAEAEKLYGAIFETAPDNPDALHYAGVLAHQLGRSDEACRSHRKSLALVPNRADCYSNLGIIYQAQGKLPSAIAAYRRAHFARSRSRECAQQSRRAAAGDRQTRSKPKLRIEPPFASTPLTSMPTPTSASCSRH